MTADKKKSPTRKTKDPRLVAFGEKVRSLRKKAGYSQEDFAYHCDLHPNYVGGIERGERNIALLTLFKLAQGLNLKLSELLDL